MTASSPKIKVLKKSQSNETFHKSHSCRNSHIEEAPGRRWPRIPGPGGSWHRTAIEGPGSPRSLWGTGGPQPTRSQSGPPPAQTACPSRPKGSAAFSVLTQGTGDGGRKGLGLEMLCIGCCHPTAKSPGPTRRGKIVNPRAPDHRGRSHVREAGDQRSLATSVPSEEAGKPGSRFGASLGLPCHAAPTDRARAPPLGTVRISRVRPESLRACAREALRCTTCIFHTRSTRPWVTPRAPLRHPPDRMRRNLSPSPTDGHLGCPPPHKATALP